MFFYLGLSQANRGKFTIGLMFSEYLSITHEPNELFSHRLGICGLNFQKVVII